MYSTLFILFIGINLVALFLGNYVEHHPLPECLDFKPINCRKCLSTHISWVLNTLVATLINSWFYFIIGILTAGVIFYLLDREDKKQFE